MHEAALSTNQSLTRVAHVTVNTELATVVNASCMLTTVRWVSFVGAVSGQGSWFVVGEWKFAGDGAGTGEKGRP